MAHRHSVAPRKAGRAAPAPGLWIVDAETSRAFELQAGDKAVVIPAGRSVESLMEAMSQSLDAAIAALRQMQNGAAPSEVLDVLTRLQHARGMHDAVYETLVDAALNLGRN